MKYAKCMLFDVKVSNATIAKKVKSKKSCSFQMATKKDKSVNGIRQLLKKQKER